jgi:hypothetical protein
VKTWDRQMKTRMNANSMAAKRFAHKAFNHGWTPIHTDWERYWGVAAATPYHRRVLAHVIYLKSP